MQVVLEWRGFRVWGRMTMADRVAVFIDYQNVYKRGRAAFGYGPDDWHIHGQIRPLAAGLVIRGPDETKRTLVGVHLYRGLPSGKHNPGAYAAAQRQVQAWRSTSRTLISVRSRPLNYRDPHRPHEKGIDVALAVDFVMGFQRGDFDIGVIFSEDTDLHPALEAVGELAGSGHAELATWYSPRGPRHPMSGGQPVRTRILSEREFRFLADPTDYNKSTPRKPRPPR